jgi:hypothetical protein
VVKTTGTVQKKPICATAGALEIVRNAIDQRASWANVGKDFTEGNRGNEEGNGKRWKRILSKILKF